MSSRGAQFVSLKERLSGFIGWQISRKLFLLGSVGILATLCAGLVNALLFGFAYASAMDLDLVNRYIAFWVGAQVLITGAAVPSVLSGQEGRWTAYLFVAVQSPFIVGLLHLYGTMSTPLVAIYPSIVILWALVLDERIGLFGFCNLVAWMAFVGVAEALQWLPYAPMLVERDIDAQNDPVWFVSVFLHILVLLGFCISLCILFQRTQRRQQARMRQAHGSLEQAHRLIRRYVPARLADQIAAGEYQESTRPERRKLTIVFAGIEDFIGAAEELDAEDLVQVLGEYLSEMVTVADTHDGTVSHVLGDCIMVLFGAPTVTDDRDHAHRAVNMALDMQERAEAMRDVWARHGLERPFRIRVGINTGYVSVGDFGSPQRRLYSGMGLQTHVAKRIQDGCPPGRVMVSHSTWALVQDGIRCASSTEIAVEGLSAPLRVYTLHREEEQGPPASPALAGDERAAAPERGSSRAAGLAWRFGKVSFDEGSLVLSYDGEPVVLERKPLEVLRYLLRHAGELVTKDQLFAAVWPGRIPSETVVAKCISRLREVLRDHDQGIIKTVHGYGYRFVAELQGGGVPEGESRAG